MNIKKIIALLLIFVITSGVLTACQKVGTDITKTTSTTSKTEQEESSTKKEEIKEEVIEVKLMAVGDNLIHESVVASGKNEDGTYSYDFIFENIKSYVQEADISVINQETIFGGDDLPFTGYPNFNTPTKMGDTLIDAGFNVVLNASNHTRDMGLSGVLNAIKYWKTKPEVMALGIHEDKASQEVIPIMEVKGIKFALLNYTYSHNWESFSADMDGRLNMLCDYNKDTRLIDFNTINPQVIEDIKKAKEQADVVIVFPHWGSEYTFTPTTQQVNFGKLMTEAGADLIIGAHPHVIQPVEWISAANGNKALCFYSLGNFVSSQDLSEAMLGAMASVTFRKENGIVSIDESKIGAIPIVTHYAYKPGYNPEYKRAASKIDSVYLLSDYTQEKASTHGITPFWGEVFNKDLLEGWATQVLKDYRMDK